jgi:hypothetical protein
MGRLTVHHGAAGVRKRELELRAGSLRQSEL